MSIEAKIKEMGLVLPKATDPVGSYVATKISNNLLYISGQISIDADGQLIKGKVGKDFNTEQAYKAAQRCALNIICLLYTSPSPRDEQSSRMPSSA